MFQLGSLVVLCGLLTGTSAQNSEFIQKLMLDMRVSFTQERETGRFQFDIQLPIPMFSLDSNRFNFNFPSFMNNMRIRLKDLPTLVLQAGLSANDNSTEMKMPLIVDASVLMSNDNPRYNTTIALKLQCSLRVERESQNSLPYVSMWKCSNETMKDISD